MKNNYAYRWLIGIAFVEIEGYFIEQLINLSIKNNINLYNIKRINSVMIRCEISIKDIKKINNILEKTQCKIKILDKKGLFIVIKKLEKRKTLIIFLFIVISIVMYFTKFIWKIDVQIDGNIPKEDIINLLNTYGVKIGDKSNKINLKEVVEYLRFARDDISWASAEFDGVILKIEIKENIKKPEIVDLNTPCNIVAEKEGIVEKIEALSGTIRVEEGQYVKKGDILIEGIMEGQYTGIRYVHSQGNVWVKNWYTEIIKSYYKKDEINITNRNEIKYAIKINNFRINLYKTLSKFEFYDTINESYKVNLFGKIKLPIEFIKIKNNEYTKEEKIYSHEQVIQNGIDKAKNKLNKYLNEDSIFLREIINTYENDQYIDVEVTYEILESIGTKEKNVF